MKIQINPKTEDRSTSNTTAYEFPGTISSPNDRFRRVKTKERKNIAAQTIRDRGLFYCFANCSSGRL